MTLPCGPSTFGADPVIIKWQVVRGDTSNMRVEFYQPDEKTPFDTEGWACVASVYDPKLDTVDELISVLGNGFVEVTAPADVTKLWGSGHGSVIAELLFDVQITTPDNTIWTPVVGSVVVLGDVTYGGTL